MNELKCTECGETLTEDMTECPRCGCPVEKKIVEKAEKNISIPIKGKINVGAVIALVLGCIVLFMGSSLVKKTSNKDTYEASLYQVDSAKFGADFYTEIYQASDTIVDELNDINNGIATISESTNAQIDAIYYASGMIVIALGLAIVSISAINIYKK